MPRLLQAKAIEAFETSKRARGVGRPGEGLSIDYQLLTTVRAFEYRTVGNGGDASIEVFAKLMDDRNGRIIGTRLFTGVAAVRADTAEDVVAGLDAALDSVLIQMVRWTLTVI
jgi:cholesterol transport system auxiliary component